MRSSSSCGCADVAFRICLQILMQACNAFGVHRGHHLCLYQSIHLFAIHLSIHLPLSSCFCAIIFLLLASVIVHHSLFSSGVWRVWGPKFKNEML